MERTRRQFIREAGACLLGATAFGSMSPRLLFGDDKDAKAKQTPTLVTIYLRGGADAISVIVPYADKHYAQLRPTLAVPGPDAKDENRALTLDKQFGFNPNMKELHKLYEAGKCAPIICTGSPHPTRSHFDAQDFMERGAPGLYAVRTGWLSRFLNETRTDKDSSLRALAMQSLLPRSLRGDYPVLARPDRGAEQAMNKYAPLYPAGQEQPAMEKEEARDQVKNTIQEAGEKTIAQLKELGQILDKAPAAASKYPEKGNFGRQMGDIAKLIKSSCGLEVVAVDYNGWDHHINEGPIGSEEDEDNPRKKGDMAHKLADLSAGIGAFVEDLGPRMDQVLVLVMSEFGRMVKENANKGTDHGHGGFMLAVGGKVKGKKVYGKWTGLEADQLYQKRDLPVHTDFRVVFAETLQAMFGFDGIKKGLFPEYKSSSPPLEFLM